VTRLRQGYGVASELMNSEKLNDFAARYAKAWCSQNSESVATFFAENGSLKVNNDAPAVGRAAIAAVARGFMRDFPDMIVAMDELEIGGRSSCDAVFHWTLMGTYAGTGKRVRISGYELWRMDNNGLIAESRGHFDAAEYERQLRGYRL
jgi:predicted ester cyclase